MAKKKRPNIRNGDGKEAAPALEKTEIAIHCKYDKLVDPKKLKPHPANPWKHPESQIDLLAKIMAKPDIGIRHEIIVSKTSGFIVEGHCRREAAIKLNIKEYPVVYQEFESEATERAVMLNDNKVAEFAEVDGLIMADNLVELDQLDYPLDLTAFNESEIRWYIDGPSSVTPDEVYTGMPEFEQKSLGEFKLIAVRFMTEKDYIKFAELIGQNLTMKTKAIWYPKQDLDQQNRDNVYEAEEK